MVVRRRSLPLLVLVLLVLLSVRAAAAQVSADEQAALDAVRQGFDLLLDRFVRPVGSEVVLGGAWRAAVAEAASDGREPGVPAPLLTGERERDWSVFRSQFLELAAATSPRLNLTRLARAAVRGMAQSVEEGHTVYMDPRRFAEHQAWSRGDVRYGGIGARITGSEPTVVEVFDDSPAARAGLQPGDLITHVDGQPVGGLGLAETIGRVRGPEGTEVVLTVRRPGVAQPLVLSIVREQIQLRMVLARMLPDQVGYLQLRGFPEPSVVERVRDSVAQLHEEDARALVLDLRGNSGGRLDVGRRLLNLFLSGGALYQQITRDGAVQITEAQAGQEVVDLPLVVLVDTGTASMGEIFASALQEHGAAVLIGEITAGSVAAGQVYPLADGSALQVTVMEIRSGQGRPLNGVGVAPDVVVSNSLEELRLGRDAQLEAALEYLARPEVAPGLGRAGWMHGARARAA